MNSKYRKASLPKQIRHRPHPLSPPTNMFNTIVKVHNINNKTITSKEDGNNV